MVAKCSPFHVVCFVVDDLDIGFWNNALYMLLQSCPMDINVCLNVGTIFVYFALYGSVGCGMLPHCWVVANVLSVILTMNFLVLLVIFLSDVLGAANMVDAPLSAIAVSLLIVLKSFVVAIKAVEKLVVFEWGNHEYCV